jgi:hypothetical protein
MSATEEVVTDPGAEQVEGQPDEAEEAVEPEAEPDVPFEEPEPEQRSSEQIANAAAERENEQRVKAGEKSWAAVKKKTLERYAEDAQFLRECPLCLDQHKGFVDLRWAGKIPDDVVASIQTYLGFEREVEYLEDPFTSECPTCAGYGKTKTRGHVPGKTERVCPTCKGLGFQSPDQPPAAAASPGNGEVVYDLPSEEPLVTDGNDVWGSPKLLPDGQENPNYGKMPQYKNPTLP